jgi:hypothetical protein
VRSTCAVPASGRMDMSDSLRKASWNDAVSK